MFDSDYADLLQNLRRVGPGLYTWHVNNEPSEKEQEMKNQFIIGSVDASGGFSIASSPKFHQDKKTAYVEAERLANTFTGKRFIVFQIAGSVVATGVKWD